MVILPVEALRQAGSSTFVLVFLVRILYFCSFCALRLGSQWDLDAFCLDMFSQLVTCKQRHVQLHCACGL